MVTLRETKTIGLDNNKMVFAESPDGRPPKYKWAKTSSANIMPGCLLIHATGAAGEATVTESSAESNMIMGIAELDRKQVADCSVKYASGDLIPYIPIAGHEGFKLRNVFLTDPSADIEPDSGLIAGAVGACVVDDGTDTIYLMSEYFVADADNAIRIVAYIARVRNFADA